MIVAVEPLHDVISKHMTKAIRDTYIAASAMTDATITFMRRFICRSFTMSMGRIAKAQSANEFRAETANVKFVTSVAERQVPVWLGSRSHQNETGLH